MGERCRSVHTEAAACVDVRWLGTAGHNGAPALLRSVLDDGAAIDQRGVRHGAGAARAHALAVERADGLSAHRDLVRSKSPRAGVLGAAGSGFRRRILCTRHRRQHGRAGGAGRHCAAGVKADGAQLFARQRHSAVRRTRGLRASSWRNVCRLATRRRRESVSHGLHHAAGARRLPRPKQPAREPRLRVVEHAWRRRGLVRVASRLLCAGQPRPAGDLPPRHAPAEARPPMPANREPDGQRNADSPVSGLGSWAPVDAIYELLHPCLGTVTGQVDDDRARQRARRGRGRRRGRRRRRRGRAG